MTKFSTFLNGLTEDTTPDTAADFVVTYDASVATSKKVKLANIAGGTGTIISTSGWTEAGETWTYAGADDPTYTLTIATDLTGKYSAGMRVRVSQVTGGTKYFIITKVAYGAPNTTLTLYGGTDYNLENEAISSPYYSVVKAPFGFPLDPTKWTVTVTDTSDRSQATPTTGTWYNLGTTNSQISIPIGAWLVTYKVTGYGYRSGVALSNIAVTLSNANNTESDPNFTSGHYADYGGVAATLDTGTPMRGDGHIVVATKTTYYLNAKFIPGGNGTNLTFQNTTSRMMIRAVCAYL